MPILFTNIKELLQVRADPLKYVSGKEMGILPTLQDAYLVIENGLIADFGKMENCPNKEGHEVVDASGKMILPTWCDSHTHIVYAGNREGEFVDRIKGLTYEEIAQRGGGILNSAQQLQHTSEEILFEQSKQRLEEVMRSGTGAIEIKSGYGLNKEAELKMLRVIRQLATHFPIPIKATFLGAHALPRAYQGNQTAYLNCSYGKYYPLSPERGWLNT